MPVECKFLCPKWGTVYRFNIVMGKYSESIENLLCMKKNYSPDCMAGEDEGKSGYFQCAVHLPVQKWNWHKNFLNLCIRGVVMYCFKAISVLDKIASDEKLRSRALQRYITCLYSHAIYHWKALELSFPMVAYWMK